MGQSELYDKLQFFLASGETVKASSCIVRLKKEYGEQNNPQLLKMEQECLRQLRYLIKDRITSTKLDDVNELVGAYETLTNDSWVQDQKKILRVYQTKEPAVMSSQQRGKVQGTFWRKMREAVPGYIVFFILLFLTLYLWDVICEFMGW